MDVVGDIIDVVVFPIIYKSFPFYGKGIYELNGKVIDEHSFYSLDLTSSFKCRFMEDVRYLED
jgi:DNA polymerase-3 subunit alpha